MLGTQYVRHRTYQNVLGDRGSEMAFPRDFINLPKKDQVESKQHGFARIGKPSPAHDLPLCYPQPQCPGHVKG